jgi:flagellar hook assembly protein FlgD
MKYNSLLFRVTCGYLLSTILSTVVIGAPTGKIGLFEITKVGVDKKSFDPSSGETVALSFEITEQADVHVFIYDRLGQKVQNIDRPALEAGIHSVTWDGRNANGKLASGDVFLYVIQATTKDGKKAAYNMAEETGGLEVKSLEYTLDRDTGAIGYVLPKACMIRIRAGLMDGMFAKSLFDDWKPSVAGRHTYQWDGKDNSGQLYLLKSKNLDIRLTCYTLADNTIIVTGNIVPFEVEPNLSKAENQEREHLWATKGKYLHYRHDPQICHPPRFKVLFPTANPSEKQDANVIAGVVPIRIELDPRDVKHLINTRFEVMLFIDGVFIYEIEEGSSPFTYNWDTKDFARGPHIVTVNLMSYDDHIGIVSRKVILGD